ncbi:MAG: hypothetical protein C4536_12510 [Actinobacteria bacterium]|jgi:hypothetical protein|nr:MAG: hypothetical protein C4536_12510 [Actinomycetota bacterium]
MAEKKSHENREEEKETKGKPAEDKKPATKKPAKKRAAAAEKPPFEGEPEPASEEVVEAGFPEEEAEAAEEEKLSEEEFRRLVEESMEKVTVADIVLNIMNDLASLGYMKLGLPESVNLKYRDFDQASLAIDTLEAMIKAAEGKISLELLQPFRGTLANLQMNFVQIKRV